MKKLMAIAAKLSGVLAALAMTAAVSSVPSACHQWFAQPEEPEELRKMMND